MGLGISLERALREKPGSTLLQRALSANALTAEQRVLLRCAKAGAVDAGELCAAFAGVTDWGLLLASSDYHGLSPLLAAAIETLGSNAPPRWATQRLREDHRNSAMRGLLFSDRLLAALDTLHANGVFPIPLKGPTLAELLYSDPALRPYSDLDLLLRPADVQNALRALSARQYFLAPHLARVPVDTLLSITPEATVFGRNDVAIDLHWAIAPSDHPFSFNPEILWRRTCPTTLSGRRIECGLSLEALLLYLCVHATKHGWSRLIWLADIARLAEKSLDWDLALACAGDANCVRPFLLGVRLARDLLDAPVPEALVARDDADAACRRIAAQTSESLLRMPPREPSGLALTRFNARLASRASEKFRLYAGLLRAPTEAELALLPLSRNLFFLYFPIRVVRVATKYIVRLARFMRNPRFRDQK